MKPKKVKNRESRTYWSDILKDIKARDADHDGGHVNAIRMALLLILRSDPSRVCFTEAESKFVGNMGKKYFLKEEIDQLFGIPPASC